MSQRLGIVQPYVPSYRVPFFDRLEARLREDDVDMEVLAPLPEGDMARRADAVMDAPWHITTHSKSFWLRQHQFTYLGSGRELRKFDAVIVPGAATCLDGYLALGRKLHRHDFRVGWWGHIGSYVNVDSRVDRFIEGVLMRRADQIFAYTSGGARVALSQGVHGDRVTVVQNSIDTEEVERASKSITLEDVETFSQRCDLRGRTFTYLGGLDRDKGIDELRQALDELWRLDPTIRVLVLGRGSDEDLLLPAAGRGQVIKLGYADPRQKALAAHVSEAFIQPGRVGLVAVDALILQRPIITARTSMHAPEIEYLEEGTDVFFAPSEAAHLAEYLAKFWRPSHDHASRVPTLGDMVTRYADGVSRMLER